MEFFKKYWDIINIDLVATIQNFHEKSLNVTFIVLIPKKVGAEELKDFRPLGLIVCVWAGGGGWGLQDYS